MDLLLTNTPLFAKFLTLGIGDFENACNFVKNLPYFRNQDKENRYCVLEELGGTCSTKHALLKRLALELKFQDCELMLGIFKMNMRNTPKIAPILKKYNLSEIPEAHNYLKINKEIQDFTKRHSKPENFVPDLVQEIEISPDQVITFKIEYHKKFLRKYLKDNSHIPYSFPEFWRIREECIATLSH